MSQTTGTGAKKIQDSDNWRDIFDIHNDTVDAYDGKIGTVSLPTTAQTLTGAISENNAAIADLDGKFAMENAYSGDLNNLETGYTYCAAGAVNAPSNTGYFVMTLSKTSYKVQVAMRRNDSEMYYRYYTNNAWGNWQKIAMKSDISAKTTYTTAFSIAITTGAESSTRFYADRIGKTLYYDVVFNSKNALSANTIIATTTGLSNANDVHVSAIGSNGTGGRFRISSAGSVVCENAIPANEWFSFSGATIYNDNI